MALSVHGAAVWRACALYFKTRDDAEDAYQDTFLKYSLAEHVSFNDEEHRKAWLLRVASNVCKDMLKRAGRSHCDIDGISETKLLASNDTSVQPASFESEVIDAMRSLGDPPRTPLYLYLCEGYTAVEIARENDVSVNTVYSWISRGRKILKEALS